MTLFSPGFLWIALLVPVALWLGRRKTAVSLAPPSDGLPKTWRTKLVPLPRALQVLGLCAAAVALARPAEHVPVPLETEGIDILLCLDLSSSMTANDMDRQRTRLDVAKTAAAQFIAARPDDRIGILGFARYPDLRCPPTLDHIALRKILDGIVPVKNDGPEDATGIGTAVARAAQVLRSDSAKSKVAILLTDGEENVATDQTPDEIAPVHAGQLCAELGVRVYAIAAGTGGRDTQQVETMAHGTGGRFFTARDADAVSGVYDEINQLETSAVAEPRYRVEERFLPFLAAAVSLLFLGRLLEGSVLAVMP